MNKKITHLKETAEKYSFREMAESFCKLLKVDRKMFFLYLRIFKMQYDKQKEKEQLCIDDAFMIPKRIETAKRNSDHDIDVVIKTESVISSQNPCDKVSHERHIEYDKVSHES